MVPAMTGEDDMKLKDILTPEKVAEKFEVTVETVLDWRKLGMPWVKIGKSIYIFEVAYSDGQRNMKLTLTHRMPLKRDFSVRARVR